MINKPRLIVAILVIGSLTISTYIAIDLLRPKGILVSDATFTLTPDGGGIYMRIQNGLDKTICLVGADILELEGESVTIHQTVREGGLEMMKPVDEICIEPGEEFRLERGGYHIMFKGGDVSELDTLKVKLIFRDGEEVVVEAKKKLTL